MLFCYYTSRTINMHDKLIKLEPFSKSSVLRVKLFNLKYGCGLTTATATGDETGASVTYTTAHSNTGSLTHHLRPGMEPTSARILVRFLTH